VGAGTVPNAAPGLIAPEANVPTVDDDEALVTFPEFQARRAALGKMEGWTVRAEILGLDRSLKVLHGNASDLHDFLSEHAEPPKVYELWNADNREGLELFLDEVDRLLHNYLAAAFSLRDHSKRMKTRFLPAVASDTLAPQHDERVRATFAESPLARFIEALRNKTLHRRLPITRGYASYSVKDLVFESKVGLPRSSLLAIGDWTGLAKQYVNDADDPIVVEEVVSEYTSLVDTFQAWFRKALLQRNRPALLELEKTEGKLRRDWLRLLGQPFDPDDV
jgi:hypothetical protein